MDSACLKENGKGNASTLRSMRQTVRFMQDLMPEVCSDHLITGEKIALNGGFEIPDIVRFSCGCNMVADFELKNLVKPLQDWFDGHHQKNSPGEMIRRHIKYGFLEIMLQQTRVEAVKPYFARFMEALPDVEALAACPEDRLSETVGRTLVTTTVVRNCMPQRNRLWSSMAGQFEAV